VWTEALTFGTPPSDAAPEPYPRAQTVKGEIVAHVAIYRIGLILFSLAAMSSPLSLPTNPRHGRILRSVQETIGWCSKTAGPIDLSTELTSTHA
jgi:hypothetical protein